MQTMTLVVGPDGRVKIPGTLAGEVVTIRVDSEEPRHARRLTPEEQEQLIREQLEESRQTRALADPEKLAQALNHDEWLYGPDGLPR